MVTHRNFLFCFLSNEPFVSGGSCWPLPVFSPQFLQVCFTQSPPTNTSSRKFWFSYSQTVAVIKVLILIFFPPSFHQNILKVRFSFKCLMVEESIHWGAFRSLFCTWKISDCKQVWMFPLWIETLNPDLIKTKWKGGWENGICSGEKVISIRFASLDLPV